MKTSILTIIALFMLTACTPDKDGIQAYRESEAMPNAQINIINLWASWCQPCRQEIPTLSAFATQHPEVGVIGIALDQKPNVEKFLHTTPTTYPVRYHDQDATVVFRRFGNNTGGIPYTVIDAPQCGFRQPFFGVISTQQLEDGIAQAQRQCRR